MLDTCNLEVTHRHWVEYFDRLLAAEAYIVENRLVQEHCMAIDEVVFEQVE